MKTGVFLPVVLMTFLAFSFAQGAIVGPGGYISDFSSFPSPADWATTSRAGGANDFYDMNTEVNASITADNVVFQLSSSSSSLPGAGGTAVWSSSGFYVQTRPTQVRYIALMGKFINDTGTNATQISFSYAFTIAEGSVLEEFGMGTKVYYSTSGLPDSWINLPALNSTSSSDGRIILSTNIFLVWPNGGNLYVLWVDDNSSGSGTADPANQIDDFSLQVLDGFLPPLACALSAPASGAAFASGRPIIAAATAVYGTAPYSVQFFTNSGVGNTAFASAGIVSQPPFQLNLGSFAAGTYNVYAMAVDKTVPPARGISVTNTFLVIDALSATIDSPSDGASVDHLTSVVGSASITGGTPPYAVQFYLDGIPAGPRLTSMPYEHNFGDLFVGDHTIGATVTDARGWVSNSPSHTINITGPLAMIFAPTNGAVLTFGQQIALHAIIGGGTPPYTASFFTNGQLAGTLTSPPFTVNLGTLPVGTFTAYVRVTDSDPSMPAEIASPTNAFSVLPSAISALLSEPDDGDAVLEGRTFTVSGSAFVSSPQSIVRVEFYYDDNLVGIDTTSSYSITVTNDIVGTHRVYLAAIDNLGRIRYSETNRLIVVSSAAATNDLFINPIALRGPAAAVTSHNNGATKESGEPNHAANNSGGGSLWWTWVPSTSGAATIDTFGSDFDTLLGVYIGNAVNQLTVIGQNDDFSGLQSQVQFSATAGTVYRIAVDGYSGSRGVIRLNIRGAGGIELQAPTNETLAVVGDPITVTARILPDFPNAPPTRVEFYRGGALFATLAEEPFTAIASNLPAGSNSFFVVGIDSEGTRLQSQTATVFMQAIGVMILTPFANTTFSTTNPITINAWTYLPEGVITNVEFFVDGVSIGVDNTLPFSLVWTNVVPGSHRLIAVGHSDLGTTHPSAPVNIGVMGTLVPVDAIWRYRDDGSNQGTNWISPDFDDSTWPSGRAPLGFGDSGGRLPTTANALGAVTYYYRHSFVVTNRASLSFLNSSIQRDDGAIVYLNGVQVYFDFNMPSAPVAYTDYALSTASDDGETTRGFTASIARLVDGTNVLAVEVHQAVPGDTDLWFRLGITAAPIIIQNFPPTISLLTPTNNAYFLGPPGITLEADASDAEGPVRSVRFFANGVSLGEVTNAPYVFVWESPAIGAYVLTARATDANFATATSASVPIVVYDALGAPLVQITSPADGSVMQGPTNLLVTAQVLAIIAVTNVQFLANGEVFAEDDSEPYSVIWAAPFGTNLLAAVAFDANGVAGTSAVRTVTITTPPTDTVAPTIIAQFPDAGSTITNLTSITVRFSENVQNVDATDLLINGVLATSVDGSHSRSNFNFTFLQPAYGAVMITWAAGHGITDYAWPTLVPFDETSEGARWSYTLVDQIAPTIAARAPAADSTVANLSWITVTFSENVTGLDAADLLLNGSPAVELTGAGSHYVFRVVQPAPGPIAVTWANNHNISDLAAVPNPFDGAVPWNFILDTRAIMVQSNSLWRFVKGTNEPSVPMQGWRQPSFDDSNWSNSLAPFYFGDPYNSPEHPGTLLSDMLARYSTIYLRTRFSVANRALVTNLWLNAQSDDGFKLWLNGVEIHRQNAPAGDVAYNGSAIIAATEPEGRGAAYILTNLSHAVSALVEGENILAVQAFNQGTNSADFGFNAQIYSDPVDVTTVAPYLFPPDPPQGDVSLLTDVTITFAEPVSGVDASDLLVNGVPATGITVLASSIYRFTFAQPPFGPVLISWQTDHGITDSDNPPRLFDASHPTSILGYYIIHPSSPRVLTQVPLAGSSLTGLTAIAITFTEPVTGVDVSDLLIAGTPANSLIAGDTTNYTFSFAQPAFGAVPIRWAADHGITDVEAGNPFDPVRFGAQWNYTLVTVGAGDYVEVTAGSTMMLAGTNGAIPLRVFSSLELAELRFTINFGPAYFANFSVDQLIPQTLSVSLQQIDANSASLILTATPGNTFSGAADVALLRFVVLPQTNSAAVPLRIGSLAVTTAPVGLTPPLLTTEGTIMLAGSAPLLTSHLNLVGQRELTLFGQPGVYPVQVSTNLAEGEAGWRFRSNVRITETLVRTISVSTPTNAAVFFRTRQ